MLFAPSWLRELAAALVAAGPRGVVPGRVEPSEAMVDGGIAPSTKTADTREVHEGRIVEDVIYTTLAIWQCGAASPQKRVHSTSVWDRVLHSLVHREMTSVFGCSRPGISLSTNPRQ
jgi:hypothetical protein